MKNLNELFVHTLKDVLFAERQMIKNLPKMGDAQLPEGEKCRFRKVSVDTKL